MKKSIVLIPLPSLIKNSFVRSFSLFPPGILKKNLLQLYCKNANAINFCLFFSKKKRSFNLAHFYKFVMSEF